MMFQTNKKNKKMGGIQAFFLNTEILKICNYTRFNNISPYDMFFLEIIEIDTLLINNQCLSTFFKFWNDKVEKKYNKHDIEFFFNV